MPHDASALTQPGAPAPEPVLVVNAGSSSLKLKRPPGDATVLVERIGEGENGAVLRDGALLETRRVDTVSEAFRLGLAALNGLAEGDAAPRGRAAVGIVGHRVVHGGERHVEPLRIDDAALAALDDLSALAPLHNPANLAAIRSARELLPDAVHVAVFDTAFHATLPRRAYLYALPLTLYRERGIRRYGFHGTSHDVVSARLARHLGRPREALRIVTLHLGNGASATAIDRGRSVDTSMGFTPLEGLMMGSRSGDVDPGILLHLLREGMSVSDLDRLLNRQSGMLGLSGVSNDLRDVHDAAAAGDGAAEAALEAYAYRIRKIIGAYAAAMGGIDALAFTGGVGENDARVRADACDGLAFLGIELDADANRRHGPRIGRDGAPVETWVVATDEEGRIAEQARDVAAGLRGGTA